MADIEPPSFSLGLDFDFEPSNNHQPPSIPLSHKNSEELKKGKQINENEEDEEFNLRVSDSETDSPENSPVTRFRRLRRGGPSLSKPNSTPFVEDDDIEDFSDEDNNVVKNNHLAPHTVASCSSSKLPLSGCGVLMRQPGSITHKIQGKQDSSCPSISLGSSKGKSVFSDFTASPLRRFQLLDSESDPDDAPIEVDDCRKTISKSDKQKESESQPRFKLLDSESDSDDPSNCGRLNKKASSVEFFKNNYKKQPGIPERFKLHNSESDSDDPSNCGRLNKKASSVEFFKNNYKKQPGIPERFKLHNSEPDADDPFDVCINRGVSSVGFAKTNKQKEANHGNHKNDIGKYKDSLPPISQKQDLWQDFCVVKEHSVQTPAFDEFCDEYFKGIQSRKPAPDPRKLCSSEQGSRLNHGMTILQPQDSESVVPPSHRYFFHDDTRIQRLVRSRLPYFCPLSTPGDVGYETHNASSINYVSQFGQDNAKRQTGRQVTAEKSSRRGRKRTKNSNIEDTSLGSENWINPKHTASTPKDAGRRRVHADGQSAGRWCTSENGKKVYVTKTGKELTGQLAYRHYRKESGRGFKKSRKKGASKKK